MLDAHINMSFFERVVGKRDSGLGVESRQAEVNQWGLWESETGAFPLGYCWPPGGLTHAPESRAACETNSRTINILHTVFAHRDSFVISLVCLFMGEFICSYHLSVYVTVSPLHDAAGLCVFQALLDVYLYFSLLFFICQAAGGRQSTSHPGESLNNPL